MRHGLVCIIFLISYNAIGQNDCTASGELCLRLAASISDVAKNYPEMLYEKAKLEFQAGSFCSPQNIFNNASEKPGPLLVKKLLNQTKNDPLRVRGTIIQDYFKNYKANETDNNFLKMELARNHIFKIDSNNEVECPFVSKEAFLMGLKGLEVINKKKPLLVKNKKLLTIVDYTRPSNERRLFVIDITTGNVLHNTWVAHGSGGAAAGKDGLGSSPTTSNVNNSNMSSEGFILASRKSHGNLYGNNVLLEGIDAQNSLMAKRSMVLHGWSSPAYEYNSGFDETKTQHKNFLPGLDVIKKFQQLNFKTANPNDMEKALFALESSVSIAPYLETTEGCLGVSIVNMKHLDVQGRDKTQVELLREDLPGSLIFNYTGPSTQTNFRN
jgi:hypothetical protein